MIGDCVECGEEVRITKGNIANAALNRDDKRINKDSIIVFAFCPKCKLPCVVAYTSLREIVSQFLHLL